MFTIMSLVTNKCAHLLCTLQRIQMYMFIVYIYLCLVIVFISVMCTFIVYITTYTNVYVYCVHLFVFSHCFYKCRLGTNIFLI